jgi:hypothetical protein
MNKKPMRSVTEHGYILVVVGKGHHLADVRGYAYEHRVVAEQKIGRRLRKGELVHLIDKNRQNNDPNNLEVKESPAHHLFEHRKKDVGRRKPNERNPIIRCRCGCGELFRKYDSSKRPRIYISGHNPTASTTFITILICLLSGMSSKREILSTQFTTKAAITCALSKMCNKNIIKRTSRGNYSL